MLEVFLIITSVIYMFLGVGLAVDVVENDLFAKCQSKNKKIVIIFLCLFFLPIILFGKIISLSMISIDKMLAWFKK